jgi:hypothetical protein
MEISRLLRGGLLVSECVRLLGLVGAFVLFRPDSAFPWLLYVVPNALFPLIALFLWLDFSRYAVYLPLYLAGKCVGIFSIVGWLIASWPPAALVQPDGVYSITPDLLAWILLCGDLCSSAAALIVAKKTQTPAQAPVVGR